MRSAARTGLQRLRGLWRLRKKFDNVSGWKKFECRNFFTPSCVLGSRSGGGAAPSIASLRGYTCPLWATPCAFACSAVS